MAKFNSSAFIGEIRGKVSDVVYSRCHYGAFYKSKGKPTNPKTDLQKAVREKFRLIASLWSSLLTDEQREGWEAFSKRHPRKNVFGEEITLPGFIMFLSINRKLQEINESIIYDSPKFEFVESFESFKVEVNSGEGIEDIKLYISPSIDSGTKLVVYATPVISNGRKYVKDKYRKIGVLDSGFISGSSIKGMYLDIFGVMPKRGERSFYKIKAISRVSGIEGMTLSSWGRGD